MVIEMIMSVVSLIGKGDFGVEFCVERWPIRFGDIKESGKNSKNSGGSIDIKRLVMPRNLNLPSFCVFGM